MYGFIKFILNRIKTLNHYFLKEVWKHHKKAFALVLAIAMLSGNMLCGVQIRNQPVHAEGHWCGDANYHEGTFNDSPACIDGSGNLHICKANFPDENFRNCVSTGKNYNNTVAMVPHANSDYLTQAECNNVYSIEVNSKNIADLTGIQYFTSLSFLFCDQNQLTALDLSKNLNLQMLSCYNNHLTTLDLSKNTKLYTFGSSGQTTTAPWRYNGSNYFVNMADVVGSENLANVSLPIESSWTYDNANGIMTYNGEGFPETLVYNYDTGLTIGSAKQYMSVTVSSGQYWVEFPDVGAIVAANEGGAFGSYLDENYKLHVDLLDSNSDSYKSLYPQLANATNNNLTGTKIFDVYFTDESGTRVAAQNFGENIEIYLKVPDGWDYDNMKAFYVTTDGSEAYSIVNEVINSVPYVHITTNHFSNYAIVNTGATSTAIATGDSSFTSVCILSSLLFCAGAMLIFLKKKKGNMYR